MRDPVPARAVEKSTIFPVPEDGTFCIDANGDAILCVCPCGCGGLLRLPICQGLKVEGAWLWDGNRIRPTLEPSIRDMGTCRFHGHLRAGVWTFCDDSGQNS